ncbi:hypothetical protein MRX96_042727 [Rhipicephalus microplus]
MVVWVPYPEAPHLITSGVPTGSILCLFLFNLVLAKLLNFIACDTPCKMRATIYTDNISLFACDSGFSTPRLSLRELPIEWIKTVHYLGVIIDNHLSWQPAVDDPRKDNRKILSAARSLLARGRGCTLALALRVYNAVASARVLYRAPVALLSVCELAALDADYRNAVREYYALPHNSEVGPVPSLRQVKRLLVCGSPKQLSTTCGT